jgi:tetratricopeptide (TPR) repeat protein
LKHIIEENKLHGINEGLVNCLNKEISKARYARLIQLIDFGGEMNEITIKPLTNLFLTNTIKSGPLKKEMSLFEHVSHVIAKLFINPTENDILTISETVQYLDKNDKNELCVIIYQIVNELVKPVDLKSALLLTKSIGYIDVNERELKLDKLTMLDFPELVEDNYLFVNEIAIQFYHLANYNKAAYYFEKALEISLKVHGESHPVTLESYHYQGQVWQEKREYQKAIEIFTKSLSICLKNYGEVHSTTATSHNNLGIALHYIGENDHALDELEKSLDITLILYGRSHSKTAVSYNNIGLILKKKKDYRRAIDFFMISNLLKISEPKSSILLNETEQLIWLCHGMKEVDKMN